MLQSLEKTIVSIGALQKDLSRYDISGMTNITALTRIKKAYLAAAQYLETDQDVIDCKTTFYGSLQKLNRLGIDLNDIDLWFINTYKKEIKAEYMYQALLRSAARRGYPCFPKFEFILPQESFATFYNEKGKIMIDYRDEGLQKEVNLRTLTHYKFFFMLLDVKKDGRLIHQEKVTMTPADILKHKNMSKTKDKGEKIKKWNDKTRSYEFISKDTESVWEQWTKPMIKKTLVLQGFSLLKHSLPDLGEIFEFDDLEDDVIDMTEPAEDKPFTPEVNDLNNPSEGIKQEVKGLLEEYQMTPDLIQFNRDRIIGGLEKCRTDAEAEMLISREAATILSLGEGFKKQVEDARKTISAV